MKNFARFPLFINEDIHIFASILIILLSLFCYSTSLKVQNYLLRNIRLLFVCFFILQPRKALALLLASFTFRTIEIARSSLICVEVYFVVLAPKHQSLNTFMKKTFNYLKGNMAAIFSRQKVTLNVSRFLKIKN